MRKIIGERIRDRRIELNMTQDELASAMGYASRTSINKIELGKSSFPNDKVYRLAKVLDVLPSWLSGDDKFMNITQRKELRNSYNINGDIRAYIETSIDIASGEIYDTVRDMIEEALGNNHNNG